MSISALIILCLIVVVVLWGIVSYNRLVAMRQQCNQTFADVDVQLKRRHDLVPNLVETVKGYAGHERVHDRHSPLRSRPDWARDHDDASTEHQHRRMSDCTAGAWRPDDCSSRCPRARPRR